MMEFTTTNNNLLSSAEQNKMAAAGQSSQQYESEEVFRSMKIDQESKTPYSDATQVRHKFIYYECFYCTMHFLLK